jgi:hypothetical protein
VPTVVPWLKSLSSVTGTPAESIASNGSQRRLRAAARLCDKRKTWRPRSAVQRASRSGGNRWAREETPLRAACSAAGVLQVNRDGTVVSAA